MQNTKKVANLAGHLTASEREERENKENKFKRKEVLMQLPDYLDGDFVGQQIWIQVLNDAEEFEIFDNLDRETLGSYCSVTSRIISLRKKYMSAVKGHRKNSDILDISKELRLLESLQLTYAGKLGLTPESRLRLAQIATPEPEDDPNDDLYG